MLDKIIVKSYHLAAMPDRWNARRNSERSDAGDLGDTAPSE